MIDITEASTEMKDMYAYVEPIVKSIVQKHTKEVDKIIKNIKDNLEKTLTHTELYKLITQLSVECYYMSSDKDNALLRQECAETLLKAKQADVYDTSTGTQQARSNKSIIETTDKQVVSIIHRSVANHLKTKLDEAHRMCSVLNNVLISKNAENKFKSGAVGSPVEREDKGVVRDSTDTEDSEGDYPFYY